MKPNKVTAVGEVKIIDSKNFPETQALHLTQPAVTLHIKALEEELVKNLFERGASGVWLTSGRTME